jgi:hypothetical protein
MLWPQAMQYFVATDVASGAGVAGALAEDCAVGWTACAITCATAAPTPRPMPMAAPPLGLAAAIVIACAAANWV